VPSCPRSSLPAKVLAWLAGRLAHLTPPAPPGGAAPRRSPWRSAWTPSGRSCWTGCRTGAPAGRWGACKTEVGDSMDLLLGELGALGYCQPDGAFVTTLADLRELL
jgi:hypothetical protein